MSEVSTFWIISGVAVVVILILTLREIIFLLRFPPGHVERGQHWFNSLFLFLFASTLSIGSVYIDSGRIALETVLSPYPGSRYAFEESGLVHGKSWVYVTRDSSESIVSFYKQYAESSAIPFLIDSSSDLRISFELSSGPLFLTIKETNSKTHLYFTREGEMRVVTLEKE